MVVRRKGKSRRSLTLAGLGFTDLLKLHHGPSCSFEHMDRFTVDELRQLYTDNREAFTGLRDPKMKVQHGDRLGHWPGCRPWVWWEIDSPEPRNPELPEVEQLDRLGVLTEEELRMLERDANWPPANIYTAIPFDRPWAWWRFKSSELRDWTISEAAQLVSMGRRHLSDREVAILDTGVDRPTSPSKNKITDFFSPDEIRRFNLPAGT